MNYEKLNYRHILSIFGFHNNSKTTMKSPIDNPQEEMKVTSDCKFLSQTFNKNFKLVKNKLLKWFPDLIMNLLVESSSCYVCIGSNSKYVIKLFKNNLERDRVFRNEIKTLKEISKINTECKLVDCMDLINIKFLIMPYLGLDGIELVNQRMFNFDMFVSMALSLVKNKDEIEKHNIIHADIKLENITFHDNKWHLIDWGLSYSSKIKKPRVIGTVPYILPQLGNKRLYKEFVLELNNGYADIHDVDYYSIALTLLSSLNPLFKRRCDNCLNKTCRCPQNSCNDKTYYLYNIEELYQVLIGVRQFKFNDDIIGIPDTYYTHDLVRCLIQLVLSKWPVQYKYLAWSNTGSFCRIFGVNSSYDKVNDENVRNTDTRECWEEFKNTIEFLSS